MGIQLKVHQPCPDCNSSDALTTYDWGSKCYACEVVHRNQQDQPNQRRNMTLVNTTSEVPKPLIHPDVDAVSRPVPIRNITRATMEHFGVKADSNHYWFPYTNEKGK